MFREKRFQIRKIEEIFKDIDEARQIYRHVGSIFLIDGNVMALKTEFLLPGDKTTICDALQATAPGRAPFACTQFANVQSKLTVKDHSVLQAMILAFENLKMVLEPSGAAAIAAMLEHADFFNEKRIVAFTTGGNITIEDFAKLCL